MIETKNLKIGKRYRIRDKEGGEWKVIQIMSRGGKATGKWKHAYNYKDEDTGDVGWVEIDKYTVVEMEEEENQESEEEGENEIYFGLTENNLENEVRCAKREEIESWKRNDIYEEIEWKKGMKLIKTRWIITYKEKEGRRVCKARLVVKGFMEKGEKIECEAPTCSPEGMKVVLGVIKMNKWDLCTMDIKTAYLQGDLINREVYIVPPEGYSDNKVWRLKKAVYGLKDAARKWYETLIQILRETGGTRSLLDGTIMRWKERGKLIGVMVIHVDDLCYGGNGYFNEVIIGKIKEKLRIGSEKRGRFKYLGLEIEDMQEKGIKLSQKEYIREKLEEIKVYHEGVWREMTEKEQKIFCSVLGQLNW